MNHKSKKTLFILPIMFIFVSCYHGKVDPNFYKTNYRYHKLPYSVTLDNRAHISNIVYDRSIEYFEFNVKEAILESTKKILKSLFESYIPFEKYQNDKNANVDFIAIPEFDAVLAHEHPSGTPIIYATNFKLTFYDAKTLKEVYSYQNSKDLIYNRPASVNALSIITGLTLFILSPVTIPCMINIMGNHGIYLAENNLNSYLNSATKEILENEYFFNKETKDNKHIDFSTNKDTNLINSKYDDFLNSVVIVRSYDGIGSGFIISNDGYIITNMHVIGNDSRVSIKLRNGKTVLAKVMTKNKVKDLALLKINGSNFEHLTLCNEFNEIKPGTEVIAIGAPKGFLSWSLSKGIVSSIREMNKVIYIQTDTAINEGNSGGPLIDLHNGKVIGINTFKLKSSDGLNFAIAAPEIFSTFPILKKKLITSE